MRTAAALAIFLFSALAFGQKPEYEFYCTFRADFAPRLQEANHWSLTNEQIFEKYAAKLKADGVAESEITRRIRLLRTERNVLEADYWSRYYLDPNANFNHAPNAFLMETVKGKQPGVVIDSLKTGGIVVMECGPEFNNHRNAMLHLFDSLEIVHYEIVRDKADFAGRRETDVVRLVARKP
jgi:hypothetical protein